VNDGLPLSALVEDIEVDQADADIAYVATSEEGVYKTNDGGQTWIERNDGLVPYIFHDIALDPVVSFIVYAGGGGPEGHVMYKSTDGASSWVDITVPDMGSSIRSIAIDPDDHETLYVGLNKEARLLKSTDGGSTWVKAARGIPASSIIQALAVDPSNPDLVWAGSAQGPSLYRSTDGGDNWSPVAGDIFGTAVNDLAINPIDTSNLYVTADGGLFKTPDGGATWDRLAAPSSADAVELDPLNGSPVTVYASQRTGTAGVNVGVFKSADGGATWRLYTDGMPGGIVDAVTFDPTDPDVVYAGYHAQHPQIYKSFDGGLHWTPYRMGVPGPVLFTGLVIDPIRPETLYASNDGPGGLLKSTNAGRSWFLSNAGLGGEFLWALAMDPSNPSHLVAGGAVVYESNDGARGWESIGDVGYAVNAVAIHPTDSQVIFAGTWGSEFESGALFKTTDGGHIWRELFRLPDNYQAITSIAIDPTDPGNVYVGVDSTGTAAPLMKSDDSGKHWMQLDVALAVSEVNGLAIVPADPSTLWAGTDDGAFVSHDAGVTWTPWSDGLRSARVEAIVMDETGALIYAANGAGGIARLDFP
jgi:photosystem II stability/assembly factor-like uncharacterized protein